MIYNNARQFFKYISHQAAKQRQEALVLQDQLKRSIPTQTSLTFDFYHIPVKTGRQKLFYPHPKFEQLLAHLTQICILLSLAFAALQCRVMQ